MESYLWVLLALLLLLLIMAQAKKQTLAAIINHRKNHKSKETFEMKELAQQFIGEACIIYTLASAIDGSVQGVIKEIHDDGILIEKNSAELEIVNLAYVTRIRKVSKKNKR